MNGVLDRPTIGHLGDLWWVVFWGCFGAGAERTERGAKSLLFVAFGRESVGLGT